MATKPHVPLNGPHEITAGEVHVPLGIAGLRGLLATAIEQAHATQNGLDREQWSRQLALALTNLEQAALWLLADEMNDAQAWPGGLTDCLQGI